MENLRGEQPDKASTPESTGDSDVSKKRRKKVTKIAKKSAWTLGHQTAEQAAKKDQVFSEKDKKPEEKTPETPEVIETNGPELELPPVETPPEGELIIDHSDEQPPALEEAKVTDSAEEPEPSSPETGLPAGEVEEIVSDEPTEEPPRVAPPLLFDLPLEALRRSENTSYEPQPEPAAEPVRPSMPDAAPLIAPHRLHPGQREQMFDPNTHRPQHEITEKEVQRREHVARKRGVSRGVLAGGIAGWWFGNRHGKRVTAERLDKKLQQRDQTIERLTKERSQQQETADKRLSVLERTQREFDDFMKRTWEQKILGKREKTPIVSPTAQESSPPTQEFAPVVPVPETIRPVFEPVRHEAVQGPLVRRPETQQPMIPKRPEVARAEPLPLEEQPVKQELYAVPDTHRVEMSAWHRIEVDKATGRTVEAPAVAYGEAFAKEQQQEKLARDAAKAQTAAQVGMTVLAADTTPTSDTVGQVAAMAAPAVPTKSIGRIVRDNLPYVKSQLQKRTLQPQTWVLAAGLVVLLFIAGVL